MRSRVLRHFGQSSSLTPPTGAGDLSTATSEFAEPVGLSIPVAEDLEHKRRAMEQIGRHSFVLDAREPQFALAQQWIEECSRQVALPINFCGGILIVRLYRLIAPSWEQSPDWVAAVHEAAAAYDFAFLALGHADDEADMTLSRDGAPTRFNTHPNTRAVDGINLLLAGVTAMQRLLDSWPYTSRPESDAASTVRHPLSTEIMEALIRSLREASFPILLDRVGLGHKASEELMSSGLSPIQIDTESLRRVEHFVRHRAHTYFRRATEFAVLLAGYTAIDPELSEALDELYRLWGSMGAAADDLQDIFTDFAAGVHSVCTVMAHLCVAEDASLRPTFRRSLPEESVRAQRGRLAELFGATEAKLDHAALMDLLNEVELRKALAEYFDDQGSMFAAAIYKAVDRFGFSPRIMIELVSVVSRDSEFTVPEFFLQALQTVKDENLLSMMNVQVGKFITSYFLARFWPQPQ